MIIVGLLLLVLSALLTAGITLFNGEASNAEAFGVSLTNVSIGGLFLTGVVTGVVGALGLGMILIGVAHKRQKKIAAKRQEKHARSEAETLSQQNVRLQQQLEKERTTALPAAHETHPAGADSQDATTHQRPDTN